MEKLEKLQQRLNTVQQAHQRFAESVRNMQKFKTNNHELYEMARDSAIKRFEFTIDPLWKFLRDYLLVVQDIRITEAGPRAVYRQAAKMGIIVASEEPIFMEMVESRNELAHTYNEYEAELITDKLSIYCEVLGNVVRRLKVPVA